MAEEEKEIELIEMDEVDMKLARRTRIGKIVFFSILIALIIACMIVISVLTTK